MKDCLCVHPKVDYETAKHYEAASEYVTPTKNGKFLNPKLVAQGWSGTCLTCGGTFIWSVSVKKGPAEDRSRFDQREKDRIIKERQTELFS